MKRSTWLVVSVAVAAAVIHAACGSDPVQVDQPPVIDRFTPQDQQLTAQVGDTLRFTVHGSDPAADALTTSFLVDGVRVAHGPSFDYAVLETGPVNITGSVSDGRHIVSIDWRVVRQPPPNFPPVIEATSPPGEYAVMALGSSLRFEVTARDPEGVALTYSFLVDGGFAGNASWYTYYPTSEGTHYVRVIVSDGKNTIEHSWRLVVTREIDLPPVIESVLPQESNVTLYLGNSVEFVVTASDPEGRALTYRFVVDGSYFQPAIGRLVYRPTSVGTKRVQAIVLDGVNVVTHDWTVNVLLEPDLGPPAPVIITRAEPGPNPGEIYLEWAAVGDDGMTGVPGSYRVRTSSAPIVTEDDWTNAINRSGAPLPLPPGETMLMTIKDVFPPGLTYISVRAVDNESRMSAISSAAEVVAAPMRFGGRVVDAITRQGIANATVTFGGQTLVTDPDGVYEFTDPGSGSGILSARDETAPGVGGYYDYDVGYTVKHLDVVNLYLIPQYTLTTTYYSDFLDFFRAMTDQGTIPYPSDERRRALPIALYARPFVKNGLDYAEAIRSVAAELDQLVGEPVFYSVADATEPARVETNYNDIIQRDRYTALTWSPDWYPLAGLIEFRVHYSADVVEAFKQIVRHELGHSLGLNHSLDPAHLMVGYFAATAPTFTPDEVAVLRTYYALPRGWNVRGYTRE